MKNFLHLLCICALIFASCDKVETIDPDSENQASQTPEAHVTPSDTTYYITNAADLAEFAELVNAGNQYIQGILTQNISLKEVCGAETKSWTPIGTDTKKFKGTFDGKGYTISDLYINEASGYFQGLFGCANWNSYIKNLSVNGTITAYSSVGGIVGMSAGKILNCHNACDITGTSIIGGIVGYGDYVYNSYNSGTITGTKSSYIGGIAGYASSGYDDAIAITRTQFENCYSSGEIKSTSTTSTYAGGIFGYAFYSYESNCYYLESTEYDAVGYYNSESGNKTENNDLSVSEMTDGTLLNYLNSYVTNIEDACYWKAGDDNYPTFNL